MNIVQRLIAATPPFFARLRNMGLALAAVSTAIATVPLPLPAVVMKIAGYIAVAAGAGTAVSQAVVAGDDRHEYPE